MPQTAVIYARVSTDEQAKGYSLDTQITACQRYALEHEYQVIGEFREDYTGASMDRPVLNKLRELVSAQKVTIVLVYDIDRMARKAIYQMLIEEDLAKLGAKVEYVLGQYADSDEGTLHKQIRASIAEYEKAKIIERMRRGKVGKTKSGFVMVAARPPYGYRVISEPHKTWLEIDPLEASIVKMIFEWYLVGDPGQCPLSMNAIAGRLTVMAIPTRGDQFDHYAKKRGKGVWAPATIRAILKNETYTGIWHYGKTKMTSAGIQSRGFAKSKRGFGMQVGRSREDWIPVAVPVIIDPALFEMAQKRIHLNVEQASRNVCHDYLLGRRLKCKKCGYSYVGLTRKGIHQYYYCKGRQQTPVSLCDMPYFNAAAIEAAVWNWLVALIDDPVRYTSGLIQLRIEAEKTNQVVHDQVEVINEHIKGNEEKMNRLVDLYLAQQLSLEMFSERKDQLTKTISGQMAERERICSQNQEPVVTEGQIQDIEAFCSSIRSNLANASFFEKRQLIDLLDVRGTLAVENEEKVVYVSCKLLNDQQLVSLALTSHSSNTGATPSTPSASPPTAPSP